MLLRQPMELATEALYQYASSYKFRTTDKDSIAFCESARPQLCDLTGVWPDELQLNMSFPR